MPLTFILLQAANLALAAASLWIRFRDPTLWDDQALIYSTLAGAGMASLTAILLGAALLLSAEPRWRSNGIHLPLTLAFAGLQGWLLFLASRDTGLLHLLKVKFG